jgi:hypothetical protein
VSQCGQGISDFVVTLSAGACIQSPVFGSSIGGHVGGLPGPTAGQYLLTLRPGCIRIVQGALLWLLHVDSCGRVSIRGIFEGARHSGGPTLRYAYYQVIHGSVVASVPTARMVACIQGPGHRRTP